MGGDLVLEKINEHAYDLEGLKLSAKFPFSPPCQVHSLSGGQKTLIALSVIFGLNAYKPSRLLLLDEADSHLDSDNARAFSLYLRREMESQCLVISHRRETAEFAEEYVVVKRTEGRGGGVKAEAFSYEEAVGGREETRFLKLRGEAMREEE